MNEPQNPLSSQPGDSPPPLPMESSEMTRRSPDMVPPPIPAPSHPYSNNPSIQKQFVCCACGTIGVFEVTGRKVFQKGCLITLVLSILAPIVLVLLIAAILGLEAGQLSIYIGMGMGFIILYGGIGLIPMLLLIIAWHFVFNKSNKKRVCSSCGNMESVPVDSPRGQELFNQFHRRVR